MPRRKKPGQPGKLASHFAAQARAATPADTALTNPTKLGGDIAGPGGPHDEDMVVLDPTNSVLLDSCHVALTAAQSAGEVVPEPVVFIVLAGRINHSTQRARVGFLAPTDGAAALITELLALATRAGDQLSEDLIGRFVKMANEGTIDLGLLRNTLEIALHASGKPRPAPAYVHALLDAYLGHTDTVDFKGSWVPADIQERLGTAFGPDTDNAPKGDQE